MTPLDSSRHSWRATLHGGERGGDDRAGDRRARAGATSPPSVPPAGPGAGRRARLVEHWPGPPGDPRRSETLVDNEERCRWIRA